MNLIIKMLILSFVGMLFFFSQPVLALDFKGIWILSYFVVWALVRTVNNDGEVHAISYIIPILYFGLTIFLYMATTMAFFRADAYRDQVGEVQIRTFSEDIAPIDITQARIIDQKLAMKLADKKLGEDLGLGSIAEIGELSIQKVKDQLYWVGPIVHSGFFKWFQSKGTPGYVMVSATNERDVQLIREVNGKKIALQYQEEAWWWDKLSRHVYYSGYMFEGLTDYSFEIDDNMKPHYVITTYTHSVGASAAEATGVLVVDPQNGDITRYSIEDAPRWIDRIQPENFIEDQIDNWGKYVHGWWNFAHKDMVETTPGMSLVYGKEGRSYWYTGITSVSTSDEATVGFMLIDTRTKESYLYKQPGATERAAKSSARGEVQEKGYTATNPILYNVSGIPTYIMTLKDKSGLIKRIAMVSVQDYTAIGIGTDIRAALTNYSKRINSKGNQLTPDTAKNEEVYKGAITRINSDVVEGNTSYYFMIKGVDDKLFIGQSSLSQMLVLTQVGDMVEVRVPNSANETIYISSFKSKAINTKKSTAQKVRDTQFSAAQERNNQLNRNRVLLSNFEELSDTEKAKMLQLIQEKQP